MKMNKKIVVLTASLLAFGGGLMAAEVKDRAFFKGSELGHSIVASSERREISDPDSPSSIARAEELARLTVEVTGDPKPSTMRGVIQPLLSNPKNAEEHYLMISVAQNRKLIEQNEQIIALLKAQAKWKK